MGFRKRSTEGVGWSTAFFLSAAGILPQKGLLRKALGRDRACGCGCIAAGRDPRPLLSFFVCPQHEAFGQECRYLPLPVVRARRLAIPWARAGTKGFPRTPPTLRLQSSGHESLPGCNPAPYPPLSWSPDVPPRGGPASPGAGPLVPGGPGIPELPAGKVLWCLRSNPSPSISRRRLVHMGPTFSLQVTLSATEDN